VALVSVSASQSESPCARGSHPVTRRCETLPSSLHQGSDQQSPTQQRREPALALGGLQQGQRHARFACVETWQVE